MSAYIFCVDSGSGLPIFSRKKGNIETLPFSVKGSLNGVHMYGKSMKMELLNTITEDYCVSWKEFEESVVLIGISSGCTQEVLNNLMTSIFSCMVLIVGINEIRSQRNIDRLKRELKICYPLVDRLLDSLDCGSPTTKYNSDIVGMVECILCTENHLMQILLESYMEYVDSLYSCILIHGKIAAATESWWSLHPDEMKLLSLLATSENVTTSKDIPIFLPYKSPTMAFRFVTCTLIPDVQICSLCGPTPSLLEIEHLATQCFKSSTETLTAAVQTHPRNFPLMYQIDEGILGVLLIKRSSGKYMISKNPQQNSVKKSASNSHRLDILRTFYYQAVLSLLFIDGNKADNEKEINKKTDKKSKIQKEPTDVANSYVGKETYWCSEYHKCHALVIHDNILCVLFNSNIPTYAMRMITQKTLNAIISDKQIGW
ncbi:hypothetical protein WA026_009999 [Henosepilachna vigintioctopunctata]|uniref:Fuzzy n=1 Tax=Henosepilachna vigintioctopunctata TaxID=420089 RepID=A0AAW1TSC0_9CUCU